MKSNFDFLKDYFPLLANFGTLAEQYCYSDFNSCLMKLGMIGETVASIVLELNEYLYDDGRETA